MVAAIDPSEWTVDELAVRAGLPVRTIREYQTMRLLQPPVRRGRIGIYGEAHLRRLWLIARLQHRGYSLAGIRDLLEAWTAGGDLAGVLDDPEAPLFDERPAVLDRASLAAAFPGLPVERLPDLVARGLVEQQGAELFLVPSPSLLLLLVDLTASGVPAADAIAVTGAISGGVRQTALNVAAHVRRAIGGRSDDEATLQLLRRGRGLIAQGTGRLMIHELGRALSDPGASPADAGLAGLIGELRVSGQQTRREDSQRPVAAEPASGPSQAVASS